MFDAICAFAKFAVPAVKRRPVLFLAIILVQWIGLSCTPAQAAGDPWSAFQAQAATRIAQWEATRPGYLVCGVYMKDLRTGETIVDVRSDELRYTASNMKLLTSAFALAELGRSFSFTTQVYLKGNDLVIVADGDPTLGCGDLSVAAGESIYAELDRWVDAVKTQVPGRFTGKLILCTRFSLNGQFHHPGKNNTVNPAWWSAPVDALTYHDNYYDVTFTVSGGSVTPHLAPASSFITVNNLLTYGPSTNWNLSSTSDDSTVTLTGTVSATTTSAAWKSGNHPAMLLGRTLADRLVQGGVAFGGQFQYVQYNAFDLTGAQLLYQKTTTLADSMKRMNKRSLNVAANCHFLRSGDGTWTGSATLLRNSLILNYSLDPTGFVAIEGSGLSGNQAKPRVLLDLLTQMTVHADGNLLIESLPISGVDGTLQEQGRYPEPAYYRRVIAKTGTSGEASCLSGYILDAQMGQPVVVFSIMNNRTSWFSGNWRDAARDMQDDLAKMLVDTVGTPPDIEPPSITRWRSAAVHGRGVGEAMLDVSEDGTFCEPRGSGIAKLIVEFDEAMDPENFTSGCVAIVGLDANNQPVNLAGLEIVASLLPGNTIGEILFVPALPDCAKYLVTITGATDLAGNEATEGCSRTMTALCGDVSGDLLVDSADFSAVRGARTGLVNSANAGEVKADVSLDGRVNATDLSRVRAMRSHDARSIAQPTGE